MAAPAEDSRIHHHHVVFDGVVMVDRVAQKAEIVGDRPAAAGTTRLARTGARSR